MKGTREGCLQLLVTDAVKVTESCKAVCVGGEGGWAVGMRGQLARVTEGPSLGLLQGARLTGVPYPLMGSWDSERVMVSKSHVTHGS